MGIKVLDKENNILEVEIARLESLIASRSIKRFLRSNGWVSVGSDPVRGKGGGYGGPERRTFETESPESAVEIDKYYLKTEPCVSDISRYYVSACEFQKLFESVPGRFLVLDKDLRIFAVSDRYLAATSTEREEILGRAIFDVLRDDHGEGYHGGIDDLKASFERVLKTMKQDTIERWRYDRADPTDGNGGSGERYWRVVNSPLTDSGGSIKYIIHRLDDITGLVIEEHAMAERERYFESTMEQAETILSEIRSKLLDAERVNRNLSIMSDQIKTERHRLETLMDSIADEIWFFDAESNRLYMNPAALANLGLENHGTCRLDELIDRLDIKNTDGTSRPVEETPLYRSIKGETVSGEEILCDRETGDRKYRRYRTSPVKDESGTIIGAVAVVSDITEQKQAAMALERALKERESLLELLKSSEKKMEKEISLAKSVQGELLKGKSFECPGFSLDSRMIIHKHLTGDCLWTFGPAEDGVSFFIGDISGHGIASALFISQIKSLADRTYRKHGKEPSKFLARLNRELYGSMGTFFITGIYGLLVPCSGNGTAVLSFANGGHPSPVIIRASGGIERAGRPNIILGVTESAEFTENSLALKPGDRVFFFTDGIPEADDDRGHYLGFEEGLESLFLSAQRSSLADTLDEVIAGLRSFQGDGFPGDDITVLGLEIR